MDVTMKMYDLTLNIDGIQLENVDELVNHIKSKFNVAYDILVDVNYEEVVDD